MFSWILFLSGGIAFALLASSMAKHQRHIFVKAPPAIYIRLFKILAWALLGVGLGFSILQWGATIGISRWLMLMTFSVLGVAILMTYSPQNFYRFMGVASAAVALSFINVVI
jgi:hypothetical protein